MSEFYKLGEMDTTWSIQGLFESLMIPGGQEVHDGYAKKMCKSGGPNFIEVGLTPADNSQAVKKAKCSSSLCNASRRKRVLE